MRALIAWRDGVRAGLAGLCLALTAAASPPDGNARVFDRVWSAVDRHYWDAGLHGVDWPAARARFRPAALAAPDAESLYATINHMLDLLHDSHVFAVSPAEARYEAARDAGRRQASFGFASWLDGDRWCLYAVTPGSPAAQAGVRPGWRLVSIDGQPVAVDRHPVVGERARLAFLDETGRPQTRTLTAALAAPLPTVRTVRLPGDTLLITIDGFDGQEDRRVAEVLRDTPPPAAIILDLRDNDGGEEQVAARVAGLFFDRPETLLRRLDRRHGASVPIAGEGMRSWQGPLAVLVGPRSASAAEAVAALLAESGRAVTVGERTAGALTGAELEDLPDGGQLSLAVFDVRTAGGRRIEGQGFTPAVVVPLTPADLAAGRDPQLSEALRRVRSAQSLSLSAAEPLHARP